MENDNNDAALIFTTSLKINYDDRFIPFVQNFLKI